MSFSFTILKHKIGFRNFVALSTSIKVTEEQVKTIVQHLPSQYNPKKGMDISLVEGILSETFNRDLLTFEEFPSKSNTDEVLGYIEEISSYCRDIMRRTNSKVLSIAQSENTKINSIIEFNASNPKEMNPFFNPSSISQAVQLGLFGLCAPLNFGGSQRPPFGITAILETLGFYDVSFASFIAMHNLWIVRPIVLYGTRDQKAHLLPSLVKGDLTGTLLSINRRIFEENEALINSVDYYGRLRCNADQFSNDIIDSESYQFLAIAGGVLKRALEISLANACKNERFGQPVHSLEAIQIVLGEVHTCAYVIESLVYFISSMGHGSNGRIDRSIESSLAILFGPRFVIDALESLMDICPLNAALKIRHDIDGIKTMAYALGQCADMAYVKNYILYH
ncbi:hypothetical protein ACOME3_009350 [Neoechinorhynchus agilis]